MQHPILDYIYLAHRRLTELESHPRDFGTGHALFASDIHTIAAVAKREGSNMTEIASNMGISVPAVFKFTTKLVKLGYLSKQKQQNNAKEVVFYLSEQGKKAAQAHEEFERKTFAPLYNVEEQLSASERQVIQNFLHKLNQAFE